MIPLEEQSAFIKRHLADLEQEIGLSGLASFPTELAQKEMLLRDIEGKVADVSFFRKKSWDGVLRLGIYRATQYSLIRALGATRVIETGVLHGLSSSFLLQALADNGNDGRLISIDYPSTFDEGPTNQDGFDDTLPPEHGSGWVVPDRLRSHWDLRLGPSSELLGQATDDLGGIDLFIHDSEHTWETMMQEFETAWPTLREGGVLLADNINVNTSFFDFSRAVGRIPFVMPADPADDEDQHPEIRFGIIRK